MESIFSVDVEDWFHLLDLAQAPDVKSWRGLPSRVEDNFITLLDLFSERSVRVTCFFLGWVAERFPHLVREAASRGHEIASHGFSHQLVYGMNPYEFLADIRRAKQMIEQVLGDEIFGYRCPGFSVTKRTPWFFEKVAEAGYRYDSSVFPAARAHGGLSRHAGRATYAPYVVPTIHGPVVEFPITVAEVLGRPMCFFGGGYFRLAPYGVMKKMGKQVMRERRPIVFYIHPREIDPDHPRLPMNPLRRFKSYVGLASTRDKVEKILDEFSFTTFESYLRRYPLFNMTGR